MLRTRILIILAGLAAILVAYGAVFAFLALDGDNASLRATQTALDDTTATLQETRVALAESIRDRVAWRTRPNGCSRTRLACSETSPASRQT